ncbi:hypothetical protein DP144_01875 [Clostridium tetani]|uniref:hypothetical protein n=1 Tax=Clostridium tetani TaxID=1513 RepID=UPI00100B1AFE|nr:hypothetical protein [Clostridium tetani]RXM79579.1 hypothetical protein DP154_01870 [Clostridium tetani]RYV00393.1 hypothetical protein DP144_01875 [Clostridium tetani]
MDEETNALQEELYPVHDLIENCQVLTGYKKEVAAGALFNCGKKEIGKKEFKGRIENFLGKKVE